MKNVVEILEYVLVLPFAYYFCRMLKYLEDELNLVITEKWASVHAVVMLVYFSIKMATEETFTCITEVIVYIVLFGGAIMGLIYFIKFLNEEIEEIAERKQ